MKNNSEKPSLRERLGLRTRVKSFISKTEWLRAIVYSDLLWGVVFSILIVILLLPTQPIQGDIYSLNSIAQELIVAPRDMNIPDPDSTERKKQERLAAVRSVYSFDDLKWRRQVRRFERIFEIGRDAVNSYAPPAGGFEVPLDENGEFLGQLAGRISEELSIEIPHEVLSILVRKDFGISLQNRVTELVGTVMRRPIVNTTYYAPLPGGYELRPLSDPNKAEMELLDLQRALQMLRSLVDEEINQLSPSERLVVADWLQTTMVETAEPDQEEISRRLAEARNVNLYFSVKKGEVLARPGDKITDTDTLAKINHVIESRTGGLDYLMRATSLLLFTAFLLYALSKFSQYYRRRRKVGFHLFLLLTLILAINLTLVRVMMMIADSFSSQFALPLMQSPEAFYWAVPFAAGSMLVALLVGSEIAAMFSIVLVILTAFLFNGSFTILLYALIGCFTVIYGLRQYRERTALIKSGIALGLMNVIAVLVISLFNQQLGEPVTLLSALLLGFFGGLLAAFVASFVLPVLESLFQVTTDIKLLELSNHEHPLLRELFLKAPGTFQHSIMVGYLAEAAAAAVGANPLFCRVACLYHDIGKMLKPPYYVENTSEDIGNKHKGLSPHMSALIIINHVKEGIELARRYRLPESIVDIIPQHHGTKLIRFFYEKAKRERKRELGTVNEDEFRYTGPKPQTRDAGIIMIADGAEAAARTLDDPTPARFKGAIKTIIDTTFLDGQLDECDLTLKDLTRISEAFLTVLTSMHHERVKYPGVELEKGRKAAQEKKARLRGENNRKPKGEAAAPVEDVGPADTHLPAQEETVQRDDG